MLSFVGRGVSHSIVQASLDHLGSPLASAS